MDLVLILNSSHPHEKESIDLSLIAIGTPVQADDRPNVLFILNDDQSLDDYGSTGHPHLKTPHLDHLAREGLIYERTYTTASICLPIRSSLFSPVNRYAHRSAGPEITGLSPHCFGRCDHASE